MQPWIAHPQLGALASGQSTLPITCSWHAGCSPTCTTAGVAATS